MSEETFDYAVIGAGIVGLATAQALLMARPGRHVVVLEKEREVAAHQTGHNSGVIHSGIYYKPGSLKARLCREGSQRLVAFCREHGLPHEVCGKVIVATGPDEMAALDALFARGQANSIPVRRIDAAELRVREPHVRGVGALHVASTGIVDFKAVCRQLAALVERAGSRLMLGAGASRFRHTPEGWVVEAGAAGTVRARFLINCAGLHSDRVARLCGATVDARIVPFRGEYYELVPARRGLVKGLVYPVPNPDFPFLGVHFTRMIDGSVHAGPNAVLSLRREGYRKSDFALGDFLEVMAFGGFWRLARRNVGEGWKEIVRSFSKRAFTRSLQALVPEIREADLVPTHAGVRAQALRPDGSLVDDFLIVHGPDSLHVCNAPSPAATSALAIGDEIVRMVGAQP